MLNPTRVLGQLALGLIALAVATLVYLLARRPPEGPPDRGMRGLRRQQALAEGGLFATSEPLVRFVAGRVAHLPLDGLRAQLAPRLLQSGDYLGLTADELVALSLLAATAAGALGALATRAMLGVVDPLLTATATGVGLVMPYLRVQSEGARRARQVERSLPFAIDLASLAMSAGLDFQSALRQVTDKAPDRSDALYEELVRLQREIDLGYTRRRALEGLAERCPTESVRDFVGAVVQAEEKGNPLAEVLTLQAAALRVRRSVRAEEAAARAGVLMLGPLMLIFASIMLIILGPFLATTGFGQRF